MNWFSNNRVDELENWRGEVAPWKDIADKDLKGFKSWKDNDIIPWKKIVDRELSELGKDKLEVSDYWKERDLRDEKFNKLQEMLDEAMPKMAKGLSRIGDRVAKVEEQAGEIEEAVSRLRKEKKKKSPKPDRDSGGSAIKTSQFPDGNIYMIQQQIPFAPFGGYEYAPPRPARTCRCHHTPCIHVDFRIKTSSRKKWYRN